MGRKINIRPTSGVYATYKRLSYQPWTAIAEFVDNSTQSFYDHQEELMITKYYNGLEIFITYCEDRINGDSLTIVDNAYGMEWEDFQRAVILDRPPRNTSGRNEFGMGLKTAASWFGSLWSVESTQLNSNKKYYVEIDIEELGKYKTEEINVDEEDVRRKDHYTKIVIRNLNQKIRGPRTVGKVKELLSSIYRQDIRSGLVKIYYNDNLLSFSEPPVYVDVETGKTWKKDINFSINHEGKNLTVSGFIAIRIPGSLKDAGLTLLRRGRVIVGGADKNYRPTEIFGHSNSYAWQRLYGELHMDNWPVTQAKDSFDWNNSGLEEAFIEALRPLTAEYARKANEMRIQTRINTRDVVRDAASGLEESGIVENESLEEETEDIPEDHTEQDHTEEGENSTTETDENTETEQSEVAEEVVTGNNSGIAIEGSGRAEYKFKHRNIRYTFHIIFNMSNPEAHWLVVNSISEVEYTISMNMRHSFFIPFIEKREFLPIIIKIAIALVLAEIVSRNSGPDGRIDPGEFRIQMNDILESVQRGDDTSE